jgi:hypothetical protein
MKHAVLTLPDGRRLAIMRRWVDGWEVLPIKGAHLRPGERFDLTGTIGGDPTTAEFVVGGRCGPKRRCYRLRGVGIK